MPLTIIGLSRLRPHPNGGIDIANLDDQELDYPGRAEGLQEGPHDYAEGWQFIAGSGASYGGWRNQLAILAGYPSEEAVWENPVPGPFVELINFSDNEGWIGPVVAAKLAKDFDDHAAQAAAISPEFHELYRSWQRALALAADGGAIWFV
jgi:hypothetical protein